MKNTELIMQEKHELISAIKELEIKKKEIEAQEKSMREELTKAMEDYGVLLIENEAFTCQYFPESTRETFDSKAFKKQYPNLASEYMKTSVVKPSVRFTIHK